MSSSRKLEFTSLEGKKEEKCLNKACFTNLLCNVHIRCEGTLMPLDFQKMAMEIVTLEVRDDDVWVCSFPKTGTTWTQEMVWCVKNNVDLEGAKVLLRERFPYIEGAAMVNLDKLLVLQPDNKMPTLSKDSVSYVKSLASPRFIKSHLPFHLLPLQLQQGSTRAKIVYVSRNVKDTCVSYYYHHQLFEGCKKPSLEQFATLFMNDAVIYAPFWDHVKGFWKRRNDANMLFLKYEELKEDLESMVAKVADFLNVSLTEQQVATLCDHLSFDKMRHNKSVNYEELVEFNRMLKLPEGKETFMRSGKVGDWKTKFSSEWVARLDAWAQEHLQDNDLTLYVEQC